MRGAIIERSFHFPPSKNTPAIWLFRFIFCLLSFANFCKKCIKTHLETFRTRPEVFNATFEGRIALNSQLDIFNPRFDEFALGATARSRTDGIVLQADAIEAARDRGGRSQRHRRHRLRRLHRRIGDVC